MRQWKGRPLHSRPDHTLRTDLLADPRPERRRVLARLQGLALLPAVVRPPGVRTARSTSTMDGRYDMPSCSVLVHGAQARPTRRVLLAGESEDGATVAIHYSGEQPFKPPRETWEHHLNTPPNASSRRQPERPL